MININSQCNYENTNLQNKFECFLRTFDNIDIMKCFSAVHLLVDLVYIKLSAQNTFSTRVAKLSKTSF